jgi:hypothetical protein
MTSSSFINNIDQLSTSIYETRENKKFNYNSENFKSQLLLSNYDLSKFSNQTYSINNTTKSIFTSIFASLLSQNVINSTRVNKIADKLNKYKISSFNETIDLFFYEDNNKTTHKTIDSKKTTQVNILTGKMLTTSSSRFISQLILTSKPKTESTAKLTDESFINDFSTFLLYQNETFMNLSSTTKIISLQKNISSVTLYVSTYNGILSSSTKKTADLQDSYIYLITGFYNYFIAL